ncbi:MAG: hybrid sensor histidine kinase/response regulator [Salinivirgaceae bacterium]|nr:hybrid sensor histidine kinase/response regulator [Salinivirgaceae bacterium]
MENNKSSILIVDDTPKNLQVLGNTLKLKNYKVEFAINGFKALEWIEKQDFDLVLLDVMMPEMDGYEVCQKIRENNKHINLPIIFLTAKTDSESIVNGFKIGAQDYITKPFNTAELLVRVETQLELKSSREKLESVNKWLEDEVKKRTHEIEEANTKLESANKELTVLDQAKTDFLSIISNEMRTPLNGILGTLHILKDQVDSKDLVNLVSVLDDSVNKLEKFSSYALQVTSLKTKKVNLKKESLKLSSIIESCIIQLTGSIKKHKVRINSQIDDSTQIVGDHEMLVKAFSNIIENSLIRSEPESTIEIDCDNLGEKQLITISDKGEAFSDEIINQNFEVKNEETQSYDTVALDYNLVKLIIEAHDGKIELKNLVEGNSFTIHLNK